MSLKSFFDTKKAGSENVVHCVKRRESESEQRKL